MSKWWHDRVIYQIYPRSFYDSNNDGIGDIQGIIAKLDYLKELGVGALWISPIFVSPNRDFGYDVADYCGINPEYGTMADMKQLLREAKARDLKILMDLVINHTSDEHPWFKSSRNPKSAYRDYYIWQPPRISAAGIESEPNNWTSLFTGPAWTKDERSGEYYLHLFTKRQPDLNFRNPRVIAEIKKIMLFWLTLGVAGFRCDVINLIYKESLADGKRRLIGTGGEHYISTEGCHEILKQFREEVWEPHDAFIVGEAHMADLESVRDFLEGDELTVALAFEHMVFKLGYTAEKVKRILTKWQQEIDWNTVFFENHDGMRAVSRFGNDQKWHFESATMLATMLLTLRGTPFIYQGQEIGMTNVPFKNMNQIKDVVSKSVYLMLKKFFIPSALAFKIVMYLCRDHARTPMHWSAEAKAGFTEGRPWLMINQNYQGINVERSRDDENSIWNFYRNLMNLRHNHAVMRRGEITFLPSPKNILAYERIDNSVRYRVVINLQGKKRKAGVDLAGEVLTSNYAAADYETSTHLQPYEAIVLKVTT